MVQANIAIVDQARGGKGCAIVHSDDERGIQRLIKRQQKQGQPVTKQDMISQKPEP